MTAAARAWEEDQQTATGSEGQSLQLKDWFGLLGSVSKGVGCIYQLFIDGQHVAPHDGGPGTGNLIGTGDDNHWQGIGLDRGQGKPVSKF